MGWFSDILFGKKARMDTNKINDYMADFNETLQRFGDMANERLDPNSAASRQMYQNIVSGANTQGGFNMQNIQKLSAMGNLNPAMGFQQAISGNNQLLGGISDTFQRFQQQREDSGISLLNQYMRGQHSEGERQSNQYISQVNAQNMRRQANMQMGVSLLGMGLDFGKNFLPEK